MTINEKRSLWQRTKDAYNAFTVVKLTDTQEDEEGSTTTTFEPSAAKMIPAVYGAINMLAYAIAPLPKYVVRVLDKEDDYYEPMRDHPITELLQQPSPYIDGHLFYAASLSEYLSKGNIYYRIMRGSRDQPISLMPGYISSTIFRRHRTNDIMFTPWPIVDDPYATPVPRRDIIGIHGPGFDGYMSPSPIMNVALPTLRALSEGVAHQNERLRTGTKSQTFIGTDASLEGIDVDELRKKANKLLESYSKTRERGQTPVLPPGYALKSIGTVSAVDLQVIELLRWSIEDVARVWNYSPFMLTAMSASTSQPKQSELADYFARWTVPPPVNTIQMALARRLLSRKDRAMDYSIRMNTELVRVGTWLEQLEAANLAATTGAVMSVNEVRRRRLKLKPMTGNETGYDALRSPKGSGEDPQRKSSDNNSGGSESN